MRRESGARCLKVLLVDTDAVRTGLVEAHLASLGVAAFARPLPGETLPEAVRRFGPDVVIVDMARPDRDALDGVRQVSSADPRPIVMFVDDDDPAFMEAAIDAGVSSYVVVRDDLPDIRPIVQAAVALFRRFRHIEEELARAQATLHERGLIDRAKLTLIRNRKMTEPEAYSWLRRQAMQRSRRIADIASEVLSGAAKAGGRDDV